MAVEAPKPPHVLQAPARAPKRLTTRPAQRRMVSSLGDHAAGRLPPYALTAAYSFAAMGMACEPERWVVYRLVRVASYRASPAPPPGTGRGWSDRRS